jgi:hypothetical protein
MPRDGDKKDQQLVALWIFLGLYVEKEMARQALLAYAFPDRNRTTIDDTLTLEQEEKHSVEAGNQTD